MTPGEVSTGYRLEPFDVLSVSTSRIYIARPQSETVWDAQSNGAV